MRTFVDNKNQKWVITLNGRKVRKMREKLGLDLLNPQHHMQVLSSLTDRLAFIWLLCETQANEYEVDVDEFEERLMGGTFADDASEALLSEIADFSRRLGQIGLAKITERSIKAMKTGQVRLTEMMASGQFDTLLDTVESEMEKLLPESDGNG